MQILPLLKWGNFSSLSTQKKRSLAIRSLSIVYLSKFNESHKNFHIKSIYALLSPTKCITHKYLKSAFRGWINKHKISIWAIKRFEFYCVDINNINKINFDAWQIDETFLWWDKHCKFEAEPQYNLLTFIPQRTHILKSKKNWFLIQFASPTMPC